MFVEAVLCTVAMLGGLPGEASFLKGDAEERAQHWAEAAAAYQTCEKEDPALAPYARIRLGECKERLGDNEAARNLFGEVAKKRGEGPWQRMAEAYLARLLDEAQKPAEAIPLLDKVLDVNPQPWWMESWAWKAAEIKVKDPAFAAKGYAYFKRVASDSPYVATRRDAARKLLASPESEDRRAAVLALLRAGTLQEAGTALMVNAPPFAGKQGENLTIATLAAILAKPLVKEEVTALAKANGKNPWFMPWLVYALRTLGATAKYDGAKLLCDVITECYPDSQETGESLWWLARCLASDGKQEQAMDLYRKLRRECPKHYRADDAQYEVAMRLYKSGKKAEAQKEFEALGKNYPANPYRAYSYYLCGNMAREAKDDKGARLFYTEAMSEGAGDYYAHRAMDRLCEMKALPDIAAGVITLKNGSILRPFPALGGNAAPSAASPAEIENDIRIQRLRFFGVNGLEEGEWEALALCAAAARQPDCGRWYRAIACAGFAHTAWDHIRAAGWGLKKGRPTRERLEIEYPLAYWDLISAQAKESGLDPFLLLAIIRQESTFRSGVKSSAGAAGLMQVMPSTAQWLAKVEPGIKPEQAGHLESPANSLRMGTSYLVRMLDKADNNPVYALASYNAGPGNCAKWRKQFAGRDLDAFIEAIPYAETRNYVKCVLGNLAAYHSLYALKTAQMTEKP